MKKLLIALCLLSAPCFAVLSPLNQRLKEINTLVTSPEMSQYLTQYDVVEDIKREDNTFTITTNEHTMQVDIVYKPLHHPGATPFEFIFHPAVALDK